MKNFESILEAIGPLGPWQLRISYMGTFLGLVVGAYLQGYNFLAAKLDHWCDVPAMNKFAHWTVEQRRDFSASGQCDYYTDRNYSRFTNMTYELASKLVRLEEGNLKLRACSADVGRWHYQSDHYGLTVQNEWNLVCNKSHWLPATQAYIMFGAMIGVWTAGHLADRYGRRTVVLWTAAPNILVALATAAVPSFGWFVALRFVQGGLGAAMYCIMFVLNMEVLVPRHRDVVGYLLQISWGIVMFFPVAGFAYYIRHWRYLQLSYALFGLPILLMYFMLPESPRWLILHARYKEAEKIIRFAAARNKTTEQLPENLDLQSIRDSYLRDSDNVDVKRANTFRLCSTFTIMNRTLSLLVAWGTVAFIAYGLTFYGKSISGVPYITMTWLGISISVAHVVGAVAFRWYGRRRPLIFMYWVCALACFIIWLGLTLDNQILIITMSVLGVGAATGALDGVYIYTAEVYPTYIRSVGFTTCSMISRITSAIAPYVADLDAGHLRWLPAIIFGTVGLIGGCVMLCLPEMRDETLPETIRDADEVDAERGSSLTKEHWSTDTVERPENNLLVFVRNPVNGGRRTTN